MNNHYTTEYSYDLMGNILTLRRNGLQDGNTYGLIDQLSYTYNGNQLQKVTDAVEDPTWQGAFNFMDGADQQTEYESDENGNLTKDLNKNILRITYNFLNLPKEILFMDGSYIHYTYDAAGTLLRKGYYVGEEEDSTVIDYCGNYIYENGTLKKILVEGGYITFDSSQPVYHFYLKDHLGNNRVVANASGQAEQVNHYYPYGGLMAESTCGDVQRYKYNGKELDRMLGLDWYDYGARHYDGALTVWGTMDPLCEKYYGISPYVYCGNNPINAFDPDGKEKKQLLNISDLKNSDYSLYPEDTPGVLNIWAHGSYSGEDAAFADGIRKGANGGEIKSAQGFAEEFINNSKEWEKNDGKNMIIVLHSCGTSEFAKALSNDETFKGKNITFIAPNSRIRVRTYRSGKKESFVKDKVYVEKNSRKIIRKVKGMWMSYRDGKLVGTYNATYQPGMASKKKNK